MVNVTIDGKQVSVREGMFILGAANAAGVSIPTLCMYKKINHIAACRICVVEVEGMDRLVAACNTPVEEGMVIHTNTAKVREARKTNMQLILSQHKVSCTTCVRSDTCQLKKVANELNVLEQPFEENISQEPWNQDFPLIRDSSKCIRCYRCVQVCDNIQGVHIWEKKNRGKRSNVGVVGGIEIDASKCVICGQCITHCPTGALRGRDDTEKVLAAIADPEITTVVQVAPAVRSAWGDSLGLSREEATPGLMVNALRKIGFDYVFDTDFAADLTIMEEANEFLERFTHRDEHQWPMFTSCCPGWIRYMKGHHPEDIAKLSTSKSPQQMFGATMKTYFQKTKGLDPEKIFCVSIMPCVAKKYECSVPEVNDVTETGDVNASLTTREMMRLARVCGVTADVLEEDEFDAPMGTATGAAHIFGATGGVMEAALRTAYFAIMGKNPDPDAFAEVRGMDGWKESTFELNGINLRIAVASGLANTERLLAAIKAGEVEYDFVEIMACPGGCAGGGGQPIKDGVEQAEVRGQILYGLDKTADLRFSHENKAVQECYDLFLEKPCSEIAEKLLHTDQSVWKF